MTSRLLGRTLELEQIREAILVRREALVTLTGRGGAGKTSLALAAASELLDEHLGGVWLVRLAPLHSPEAVLPTIAGVIGAERAGGDSVSDAVVERLSGRGPTLIVLDNFEHVLGAAASVSDLLDNLPDLRLLITSHAPLRVTRERSVLVGALDDAAAFELIERTARQRDVAFSVREDDRFALGEIVAMLDGVPLALELAAARLNVLTPRELRERLGRSMDLLRSDVRDRADRHRSLRATVQWTLDSLEQPACQLFARLGAFVGPVELYEIETVAGSDGLDVLEALSALLDVEFVRRTETGDGRVTFGLPDALRQIASTMLDETPGSEHWRRAHAERQHELHWPARNWWVSGQVYNAAMRADSEAAMAYRWARAAGDPLARSLGAARARLLTYAGRLLEARALLDELLESPSADPEIQGQVEIANALTLGTVGRNSEALVAANAAVSLVVEPESRVAALAARGLKYLWAGRTEAALADHEEATKLARGVSPVALSEALFLESQARMHLGELEPAAALLAEAIQVGELGDSPHVWGRHAFEGDLALLRGRAAEATEHYALAVELAQEHRDDVQVCMDLCGLAEALIIGGNDPEALEVCGIAEAHAADVGVSERSATRVDNDLERLARKHVGAHAAAQLKHRGRDVDPGYRVIRACELARAVHREPSKAANARQSAG
jgi:predicted ATPase